MQSSTKRLLSLDAFRGLTIFGMIVVNHPGSWAHIYAPLRHAAWHGITPTDLIFPFFIFITGISIAFALGSRKESGVNLSEIRVKIIKRSITIFALGLLFNLWPSFNFATVRIPGVLQRIALVYLITALLYLRFEKKQLVWLAVIALVVYWPLMTVIPVPGIGEASLEAETNLGAWLDYSLMKGHIWQERWDPEGLLSTIPAIATGLMGLLTGIALRDSELSDKMKLTYLFCTGSVLILLSLAWDIVFPINKNLWTSSFALFTAGAGMLVLALLYWLIDVRKLVKPAMPLIAYGSNAITVYMAAHMFSAVMWRWIRWTNGAGETVNLYGWLYNDFWGSFLSPINASFAFAVTYSLFWLLPMWIMYKKKVFIKV